jgi:hypothetical protein
LQSQLPFAHTPSSSTSWIFISDHLANGQSIILLPVYPLISQYATILLGLAACYVAEAHQGLLSLNTNGLPDETCHPVHALRPRQSTPGDCGTVCGWLLFHLVACQTAGGPDASDKCVCVAIDAGGSLVGSCVDCIEPFNATLASALMSAAAICSAPDSPTLPCSLPCSSLRMAFDTCYQNATCVCPFVLSDGSTCSQCFATDPAESSNFAQVISFCESGLMTTPSPSTGVTSAPVRRLCKQLLTRRTRPRTLAAVKCLRRPEV